MRREIAFKFDAPGVIKRLHNICFTRVEAPVSQKIAYPPSAANGRKRCASPTLYRMVLCRPCTQALYLVIPVKDFHLRSGQEYRIDIESRTRSRAKRGKQKCGWPTQTKRILTDILTPYPFNSGLCDAQIQDRMFFAFQDLGNSRHIPNPQIPEFFFRKDCQNFRPHCGLGFVFGDITLGRATCWGTSNGCFCLRWGSNTEHTRAFSRESRNNRPFHML